MFFAYNNKTLFQIKTSELYYLTTICQHVLIKEGGSIFTEITPND